ncbi:MAG: energy-coupling factor transporter transmembrane protein EcfT [Methanoregulaceae archaeon]|nr:energy-coupling factor transporter transmembrane protein EcfT [Methanoregulaceae archaeon]
MRSGSGQKWKTRMGVVYVPGESILHRANPLTKLAGLIAVTVISLAYSTPLPLAILCGGLLLIAASCRLLLPLLRAYVLIVPLLIFVIVVDAFFGGEATGTVYFSGTFGWFHPELTSGRIMFALAMGLRLLAISTFSVLFILTTGYSSFVRSLRSLRVPEHFSFSLAYALRSITGLQEDVNQIMDAQRSRGLEFDKKILTKNRNKVMAVTIPMTVAVLHRSRHVSDAMQSRGFGGTAKVSGYQTPRFTPVDLVLAGLLAGLITALIILFPVIRVPT